MVMWVVIIVAALVFLAVAVWAAVDTARDVGALVDPERTADRMAIEEAERTGMPVMVSKPHSKQYLNRIALGGRVGIAGTLWILFG